MIDPGATASFRCPHCDGRMLLRLVHEGNDVPCPHCHGTIRVPAGAIAASVPAPKRHEPLLARATLAQWLGIVSALSVLGVGCPIFFPFAILGPVALGLGWSVVRAAKRRGERPPTEATFAVFLGALGTLVIVLMLAFLLVVFLLAKL